MKHMNEALCAAVALMTFLSYAIRYIGGRRGEPLAVGIFPAEYFTFLFSLFCLIALIIILISAYRKGRSTHRSFILFALACIFFAAVFTLSPEDIFLAGFRQKIKATVSPDELREIARVCHDELPINKSLPGPQKWSLWNEKEHRAQWNILVRSTSLGKLDPSMTIFNHSDSVSIAWGGALVGHWGLAIQTDGKLKAGDFAEGIQAFMGP
jgi:hypothetical protein